MGNVVAAIIGTAAFFFGLSANGLGAGILFAAAMGGMSWLAFGWDSTRKNTNVVPPLPTTVPQVAASIPSAIGNFVLSGTDETITPKQYGYLSIRWAHDNATNVIKQSLQNSALDDWTFARSIRENEFPAHLQFIALHAAAYWVYATAVLHISAEVIKEMGKGFEDGIRDMRTPKGEPYGEDLTAIFKRSFGAYYKSMSADFMADVDPDVFNPDVNEVAKSAVHIFAQFYPALAKTGSDEIADAQIEVERMFFSNMIADMAVNLLMVLKKELGLMFVI